MLKLQFTDRFAVRHIGPSENELNKMLQVIGVKKTEELIEKTIPSSILLENDLNLGEALTEFEYLNDIRRLASGNKLFNCFIGMGYYPTITPPVIQRNILENPGWYTQYTPYQAEISQGRLEALLNFQTMVIDLTGLPLANASLLDEGTAAAEAMVMAYNMRKGNRKNADTFLVDSSIYPQTIDVLKTRAFPLNIKLDVSDFSKWELDDNVFGLIVQYPNNSGAVIDYSSVFSRAAEAGIFNVAAADLLSLTLLKPPGEMGADAVVGSTQRFGVPMGFGGPHAAYFSTKEEFKRFIPGRIIGVSVDSNNRPALRMALQTREQHIKREKATSNICTAQVLLAIMAGMYAVYHGAAGLKKIAERIHLLAKLTDLALRRSGIKQNNSVFFDTLEIQLNDNKAQQNVKNIAEKSEVNFRYYDRNKVGISMGESHTVDDVKRIIEIFIEALGLEKNIDFSEFENELDIDLPAPLIRETEYLTHEVFNKYRNETELMRYIKKLERKDLSLTHSMIPLGSCTMKLNAASELMPITWGEFNQLHPFVPADQAKGYAKLFDELEKQLCEITGFAGVSLQPNSGAQGEFSGLMVIKNYFISRGESHRNIVLIPSSAHGTNPASAVMAGNKVVIVECDKYGNVELEDLQAKAELHSDNLNSLMITYPSTHGVFEHKIKEICDIVHRNGGQVYMDGANMNAQVGYTNPYVIGADVCHLNLHKTFTIPHGGGGPGVGPIAVAEHLVPFLPGHSVVDIQKGNNISAVSAAPFGSASILPISYAYIRMMGTEGLKAATAAAIINANYIKTVLEPYFPVLYTGKTGFVGHELIFDIRPFKATANIEVEDVAKRLMDYGYHAPTVSFPVPGTLMVEPTESESKEELDRFCRAMISIKAEIEEIEKGMMDKEDNVLKNAPHTAEEVVSDEWNHKYSREKAAYPADWCRQNKFWPSVGRINNAYGDRNLVCSCLPLEAYQ
ncbi:MAG: aminomethyl-transferring glycine dehydrogenase [Melioribacteraceae bacterium]|nr:aminomethyl-transferring glycine dehydrogenase [Melioribacteraceae bacterium]